MNKLKSLTRRLMASSISLFTAFSGQTAVKRVSLMQAPEVKLASTIMRGIQPVTHSSCSWNSTVWIGPRNSGLSVMMNEVNTRWALYWTLCVLLSSNHDLISAHWNLHEGGRLPGETMKTIGSYYSWWRTSRDERMKECSSVLERC